MYVMPTRQNVAHESRSQSYALALQHPRCKIYNVSKCTKFTKIYIVKIYIVKIYNVSNSLARFRIKLVLTLACYSSGVVVENAGAYDREF
jgi:hypothetical protein